VKIAGSNSQERCNLLFLGESSTFLKVHALSLTTFIRCIFIEEVEICAPLKRMSFLFFHTMWHKAPKEKRAMQLWKSLPDSKAETQIIVSSHGLFLQGIPHLAAQKEATPEVTRQPKKR